MKPAVKSTQFVEKQIGGEKNGGTRMVRVKRLANDVPTVAAKVKGTSKNFFSKHARKLRAALAPGAVAIILAGAHKGKRVVVLKQLGTGLLLITGPYKVNGCPMRRVNQKYLLATSTQIDVSGVKIPDNKKEEYAASEQRKADQVTVDNQVLEAIKKSPEGAVLKQYLRTTFSLSKGEFPHKMAF